MSPRPSRAAERRPQILSATLRVIAARGLDGTRLSDVAAEAGVSVGTIQHYFHTRSRLLMEAIDFDTGQAVDRWLTAGDAEADGWSQVLALIDVVFNRRVFRERWTRWLEFWSAAARDPELRAEMGEMYTHWRAPFSRAIESGVRAGTFNPRMPLDDLVDRTLATFDGLGLQLLLDVPGMTFERMRDLLVAGLAADLGVQKPGLSSPRGAAHAARRRGSRSPVRS